MISRAEQGNKDNYVGLEVEQWKSRDNATEMMGSQRVCGSNRRTLLMEEILIRKSEESWKNIGWKLCTQSTKP